MVQPASSFSSVSAAVVSKLSGTMPAAVSCPERAMEKHPACAAAISSSGFVPFPSSNRVEKEYCVFDSTPLSVEIFPLPSLIEPFHTAEALRIMCSLLGSERCYHWFAFSMQPRGFATNEANGWALLSPHGARVRQNPACACHQTAIR